jgi:RNA polymerase sigma-70 factor (ECF subfamily)
MAIDSSAETTKLLEAWRSGDRSAGAVLFDRYYEGLSRFFANKVPEAHQEDLIQESFLAVVESVDRFEERSSFRTYLFAIAHRVLGDHIRKSARRNAREGGPVDLESISSADLGPSPATGAAQHEEQRLLLEALRHIPLIHQVTLELHYWENLTQQEIAEVLGLPLGTAKTRLRDGQRHLRSQVERLAGSIEWRRSTLDDLEHWARRTRDSAAASARG